MFVIHPDPRVHSRCQLGNFTNDKGGTVMDSLLDRGIFTVPYITVKISRIPTDLAYAFRCIKSMVSMYNDDTQPRWVKTWQQQVCFSLRKHLS